MSAALILIDRLLHGTDGVTVESIARRAKQPTGHILESIEQLRRAGCLIECHPQHGMRLISSGLGCWADYIEPRHGERIGRRVTIYRETSSTQEAARQLVASGGGGGEHHGHVIVADHQTGGRGRLGRRWFAPPGGALLLTTVVAAREMNVDRLMLASCCAVAQTIESLAGLETQVRWPNDVLIDGRKIAGILIEQVGRVALIGIGINTGLREEDLPAEDAGRELRATSLLLHGVRLDRLRILDELLDRLDSALHQTTDTELHAAWRHRSCLLQQRVTAESSGRKITGRVVDVDPRHGLLLADDRGAMHTMPAATTSLVL